MKPAAPHSRVSTNIIVLITTSIELSSSVVARAESPNRDVALEAQSDAVLDGGPPVSPADTASSRGDAGADANPSTTSSSTRAHQEAPSEVTVRGVSTGERRRRSAEAVTVVDMSRARREASDIAEVLARTQGVGVRRDGGLGSVAHFSLSGLTDDQVRFFLDGVPLQLTGYPFGVANVPPSFVDRVEIFTGVVPVRFGADALGGAVNLISDGNVRGTRATASYEIGSFGTQRLALGARHLDATRGVFARAGGFFDYARNNYPVDVDEADARGVLTPARVHRFHDGYRATGGNLEFGLVDRPWARRLLLRAFITDYDKDYQNNVVMTVPYGEATYGQTSAGGSLRYEHTLGRGVSLALVGGYAHTRGHFLDVARCVYDWFGRCVRERPLPGETDSRPHDDVFWDHSVFARVNLEWRVHRSHALRLSVAPTYLTRSGDARRQTDPSAFDPLAAGRQLFGFVHGLEYESNFLEGRLQNIVFVKEYGQGLQSSESTSRDDSQSRALGRSTHRFGGGIGVRYHLAPWAYAKASYEHATRLPGPEEVFGDNALIAPNFELLPETSHNANLGWTLDSGREPSGTWRATANGFLREAERLIVLLGADRTRSFRNVFGARSLGAEGSAGWTSPGEHLSLDGNLTYVDLRNTSHEGTFGDFEGDRIPNRPYLFGNAAVRLELRDAFAPRDELSLTWKSRYVHSFFRTWESLGAHEFKHVIPSQLVHSVVLSYFARTANMSMALEIHNVTNEAAFDFFGLQRPGRALYAKTTAEF